MLPIIKNRTSSALLYIVSDEQKLDQMNYNTGISIHQNTIVSMKY